MTRASLFFILTLLFSHLVLAVDCKVGIYFGYNDQLPIDQVDDGLQSSLIEAQLTSPCKSEDDLLCGWQRVSYADDGNYQRDLVLNQIPKRTEIQIRSSSVTRVDSVNRTQLRDQQTRKSNMARSEFLNSFSNMDLIFYIGHSRFGYGPDFYPARTNHQNRVHKSFYQSQNGASILETLKYAQRGRWKHLALISCDSEKHFKSLLDALNTKISFVASPINPAEANQVLLKRLSQRLKTCI